MGPVMLWLIRIGAVALAVLSGLWLANTTPSWREDQAREELPYHWGYIGSRHYNDACLAGGCLYNLLFPQRWHTSGSWWPNFFRSIIAIGAIICAYTGWPGEALDETDTQGYDGFFMLFEPATWVLLGSAAAGYVVGVLLRNQQ